MTSNSVVMVNDAGLTVLLASRRKATGQGMFPRIPTESPVSALYENLDLCGPAILYSFTVIHPNPKTGLQPFVLALADYQGHARVLARLDCCPSAVRIGMSIEAKTIDEDGARFVFVPTKVK